jgi:hypothetical protein
MQYSYLNTIISFFFIFYFNSSKAQCINGDCVNGFGEKIYPDKSRFLGNFENGTKKKGTYFYTNGDNYIGTFDKNQRVGIATYNFNNGELFVGSYVNDEKAYGKYTFTNGDIYTGTFKNNKPDGYGTIVYKDGSKWEGQWINGKRDWGASIEIVADSLVVDSLVIDSLPQYNIQVKKKNNKKIINPRIFSVIVGVADYEGIGHDLRYSDDDAILFYNHLRKAMPNEVSNGKSILLLNNEATHANITNALQQVFSQSTENDFIIFYFSGHGAPNFFCPADSNYKLLDHSLVKDFFKSAKAKYRLCVADACFSGTIGNNQNSSVSNSTQILNDARIAVIMSSKPNQTSIESSGLHQGLFSFYFIRGLRGSADLNNDSYVTMGELFLYTKNNVTHKSNGTQVPIVYGKNLDKIPLARIKR